MSAPVVCAMGLGNNSVAMMIKKVQLEERVDLILFADTGGEKPRTYQYFKLFSKWLVDRGYPEITVVKKVRADGRIHELEEDCLENHSLPSVAYGWKTCSQKFKTAPQDKYVNNWQPAKDCWKAGGRVTKLMGFHANEPHRAQDSYSDKKYHTIFPLIEWDMDGEDCVELILSVGLPLPGKSACFFCPASKTPEILALPKDLQERAIAMEDNADLTSIKGLGRRFSWKNVIKADREQLKLFDDMVPEINCICLDGDE